MDSAQSMELTLLAGASGLLGAHGRELPQKDDLCGAFCGALALRAAGIVEWAGDPVDQDAVAVAAGSLVSTVPDISILPAGEVGRRDYRLPMRFIDDGDRSGTTAAGVVSAIGSLSGGELEAIPLAGPWTVEALDGLFDVAASLGHPVTLIVNLATAHLWGGRPSPGQLLGYLLGGDQEGPEPDWQVGHFAVVVGRVVGPAGTLYVVADTYPALGDRGVHVQPGERLGAAIERRGMAPGGVIVVAGTADGPAVRAAAGALGLGEGVWDNGTAIVEPSP
jgi:hypothetical protein